MLTSVLPRPLSEARSFLRDIVLSLVEARPPVVLVFSVRYLTGGIISSTAQPGRVDLYRGLTGQAGWLLAVWAIYLLNGITDVEEDRLNRSARPIASGRLATRRAAAICIGLASSALAFAAFTGWRAMLPMVGLLALGAVYSLGTRAAKRHGWVALSVAALAAALSYVAGALAYAGSMSAGTAVSAVLLGAWIVAAGTSKDLSDVVGDAASGRRTLPIVVGFAPACRRIAVWAAMVGVAGLGRVS